MFLWIDNVYFYKFLNYFFKWQIIFLPGTGKIAALLLISERKFNTFVFGFQMWFHTWNNALYQFSFWAHFEVLCFSEISIYFLKSELIYSYKKKISKLRDHFCVIIIIPFKPLKIHQITIGQYNHVVIIQNKYGIIKCISLLLYA